MEIIDEDPAQRWIPPGGQFCEKINSMIVLLGDMMQLDPLEFVRELVHLLVVCCHEGAFAGGLLHDLVNDQLRVATDIESCCAELDGDAESIHQGLVLHSVV